MKKQRFFIDTEGNDDEAYREAINYACQLSIEDTGISDIILLVATKANTGWLERLYGQETLNQLFTGVKFNNCPALLSIETKKSYYDNNVSSDIVIAMGLSSEIVFEIERFTRVKAIIAVPWVKDFTLKWINTWRPIELRGNSTISFSEPSCIVKKAMIDLTNSVNKSDMLTHSSDENLAKTYILALKKYEPSLDPDIVESYLIRELDWNPHKSKIIQRLISILNSGKYFQGGQRTGLHYYYRKWEKECK